MTEWHDVVQIVVDTCSLVRKSQGSDHTPKDQAVVDI
jgi:hypothetical protein